jgi:hypothetical protein
VPPVLAIAAAVGPVVVLLAGLSAWSRIRFARTLPSFRCRIGPPTAPWRRRGTRWRLRRTRAAWVNDVLLVQTGVLRLWVTPVAPVIPRDAAVRPLGPGTVRGLGRRPVVLRVTAPDGGELEVAARDVNAARLVGPFLTAMLPGPPRAPHDGEP